MDPGAHYLRRGYKSSVRRLVVCRHMEEELASLGEHEVADIIPAIDIPGGTSTMGSLQVLKVKLDGIMKARPVVQRWESWHWL